MHREEFSFPIINNNIADLAIVTPSLWRISSLEVHSDLDHQIEDNGRKRFSTASFCDMIGEAKQRDMHHGWTVVEVENKMDLLWEDFNDEDDDDDDEGLKSKFSLDISGLDHQECNEENNLEDAEELLYVQALELSKTSTNGGLVVSRKKNKMILVLKDLLKKLLLIHNMGRFKKCRS